MNPLRATVVIPTRNRRALLMRTLDSLEQQEAPADEYDVLVVLDGTEDDSEAWLQRRRPEHALRWVSQRQGGLADARNTGARHAAHDVLLFYDDDMLADRALVLAHLSMHRSRDDVLVQGYYPMAPEYLKGGAAIAYDRSHRGAIAAMEASPGGGVTIWGGNISIRKATFDRVGGFDPKNFREYGAEDTDFGLRAIAAGVPVVLAKQALALHMRRVGYASHRRQGFAEGVSLANLERVHGTRVEAINGGGVGGAFDRVAGALWSLPRIADGVGHLLSGGMWLVDRGMPAPVKLRMARAVHRFYKVGGLLHR